MITIDDATKAKLNNLTDADGKIMIAEDMPEDLKAAISYLNENNISLFSGPNPEAYEEDYEADPFASGYVDEDSSTDEDEESDDLEYDEDDDEEDLEDEASTVDEESISDLENIF